MSAEEIKNLTKFESNNNFSTQNLQINFSEIGKVLNEINNGFITLSNVVSGHITEFTNAIQTIIEEAKKALQSEKGQEFLKQLGDFLEGVLVLSEIEEKSAPILRKYGWFISDSVNDEFLIEILEFISKNNVTQHELDKKFIEYYSANNFEKINSIIDKLKNDGIHESRITIFNDCLNILRVTIGTEINSSNLVIPTLLAHIDRLKRDAQEELKKLRSVPPKENKILLHFKEDFEKVLNVYNIGLEILIEDIFKPSNIIDQESIIKPLTNELYRNKVMHGESTGYGTMPNVIRAFKVLEILSNIHIKIKKMAYP